MNRRIVAFVVLAAAAVAPSRAQAQLDSRQGGLRGLFWTPTGGLPPADNVLGVPAIRSTALQFRYGQLHEDGFSTVNNYGFGVTMRRNRTATTFELGYTSISNCSGCGGVMGGVDFQLPLSQSPAGTGLFEVGLNPALGVGRPAVNDARVTAMSGALSLPLAFSFPVSRQSRLVFFGSPGLGIGRFSNAAGSEAGLRGMLSAGATLGHAGLGRVTLSMRQIFADHTPAIVGLGLALDM